MLQDRGHAESCFHRTEQDPGARFTEDRTPAISGLSFQGRARGCSSGAASPFRFYLSDITTPKSHRPGRTYRIHHKSACTASTLCSREQGCREFGTLRSTLLRHFRSMYRNPATGLLSSTFRAVNAPLTAGSGGSIMSGDEREISWHPSPGLADRT